MSEINNHSNLDQKRDELIFDLIKRRFDNEWQRVDALDTKAGNLIGFISIVVSLTFAAGIFNLKTLTEDIVPALPLFFGTGALIISIGFALFSYRVRGWIDVPNVTALIEYYTEKPYLDVLKRNAGEMKNAVEMAEKQNNRKAALIEWSWGFLLGGLIILFVYLMTYTLYISKT